MESRERKRLLSAVYTYGFARLVLNYYSFCEMMGEDAELADRIRTMGDAFGALADGFLEGSPKTEEIDLLRRENASEMEILTAYADCLSIFEYVLNRMERRFVKKDPPPCEPETLAEMVADLLTDSEAGAVPGEILRDIAGQLPVRYTKRKFCEMVSERLKIYTGIEKESFRNVLYMLRTAATLQRPEGMKEAQPELYESLRRLEEADYQNPDEAAFRRLTDELDKAASLLYRKMDIRQIYQNMIDDLYVLFLSRGEVIVDAQRDQTLRGLLAGIRSLFSKGSGAGIDAEITLGLSEIEGVQEAALSHIHFREDETDPDLRMIEKLLSGSPFVSLDEKRGESAQAELSWIEEETEGFLDELMQFLDGKPRPVIRAIMAAVFAQLPAAFNSISEAREYIEDSLLSCVDFAEREASIELIYDQLFET